MEMDQIKQVLIVRKDLNMRKGKIGAQCAHASMKIFFDRMQTFGLCSADINFTAEMLKWMKGSFAKIVVSCDSESELFQLQQQAEDAGIINAMILDNGQTEFKEKCPKCFGIKYEAIPFESGDPVPCTTCKATGQINKPTYTVLAIGPDYSSKIDLITGKLKLL